MSDDHLACRRRSKRLFMGVTILLFCDVMWVLSNQLSDYLYYDYKFNKPYFTTYIKTSMLLFYLGGFALIKRWRYQLTHFTTKAADNSEKLLREVQVIHQAGNSSLQRDDNENETENENNHIVGGGSSLSPRLSSSSSEDQLTLSVYENMTEEDSSSEDKLLRRKVTFNSLREVRSMSSTNHSDSQILARMSQVRLDNLRLILTEICKKHTLAKTMKISVSFAFLSFLSTILYEEALTHTSTAATNILTSTSGMFTFALAAIFPTSSADKFSVSKLLVSLMSFGGIFVVCWFDPNRHKNTLFNICDLFSLLSALFYSCTLVFVVRKGKDDKLDVPLLLGIVGIFSLVAFWPFLLVLHYTNIERFQPPTDRMTWLYLVIDGAIGTVLTKLLWLWGCLYSSSLIGTLSLGIMIPLTMVWDITMNNAVFSLMLVYGSVMITVAFIVVCLLTLYGDRTPVKGCGSNLCCCTCCRLSSFSCSFSSCCCCCCCRKRTRYEEKEGLLENEGLMTPTELEDPTAIG